MACVNIGGYEGWDGGINGGKYGYIDNNGREVIPFIYDTMVPFKDGKTSVWRGSQNIWIDKYGNPL